MKNIIISILLFLISTNLFSVTEYIKRYAIVAGCNYGDDNTEDLVYSVTDAERFSKVLINLGGTEEENIRLLRNPGLDELRSSIKSLKDELKKDNSVGIERTEVIFYYSGHSNRKGLLLYKDNYKFENLKKDLDSLDSEVKIVVLDSCYSGEFTRYKGGVRKPPFIFDTSNETEGKAILTSSTGDEESQESDLYQSSFFSHALITGLRGAADSNNDKKVTLNEAYQYAFDETLKKTEDKGQITQHPAYDIELKGTGNLVITDLESQSAKILLNEDFSGIISLRKDSGVLVAEFNKRAGGIIELCVDSGKYKISVTQGEDKFTDDFALDTNETISSDELKLKKKRPLENLFKGGEEVLGGFYPLGYSYKSTEESNLFGLSILGRDVGSHTALNIGILATINSGKSSWLQGSVVVNLNKGEFKGLQASALNLSNEVKGAQVGIVNNSNEFKGVQIGLVNKTKKGTGIQIGLINISDELSGLPIGIIDIQKNGENYYNIWYEGNDNGGFMYSSFRFGSKYLYKQITIGSGKVKTDGFVNGSIALDTGVRIPLFENQGSILNDIGVEYLSSNGLVYSDHYNLFIPRFSNKIEVKLNDRLGIIGGVTTRVYIEEFNSRMRDSSAYDYINPFGRCFLSHRFLIGLEFR